MYISQLNHRQNRLQKVILTFSVVAVCIIPPLLVFLPLENLAREYSGQGAPNYVPLFTLTYQHLHQQPNGEISAAWFSMGANVAFVLCCLQLVAFAVVPFFEKNSQDTKVRPRSDSIGALVFFSLFGFATLFIPELITSDNNNVRRMLYGSEFRYFYYEVLNFPLCLLAYCLSKQLRYLNSD